MQGQRDLRRGLAADHVARSRRWSTPSTARSSSTHADDGDGSRELRLIASYGYQKRKNARQPLQVRRGARRPGGARGQVDPRLQRAGGLREGHLGPGRGAAGQHHRAADPLRGPGARGHRARLAAPVLRDQPVVPRAARRRRSASCCRTIIANQPHRGAAGGVPAARPGAAVASEELQAQQEELKRSNAELEAAGAVAARLRGAAADPAGGAAPDQRGAAGEGGAARPAEPRHRG